MSEIGRPTQRRGGAFARQAMALATGASSALANRYLNAATAQNIVRSAVRASHEPKNVDVMTGALTLVNTNAGVVQALNLTSQGSGGTNRTGRTFTMQSLRLEYTLYTQNTQTFTDLVRVTVIFDKEARGALPATADIFANTSYGTNLLLSPFNFDNLSRFEILYDQIHDCKPMLTLNAATPAPENSLFVFRRNINLRNRKVRCYNTSAGTIADIDEGSLFIFVTGNQTAAMPVISISSRVIFRDL